MSVTRIATRYAKSLLELAIEQGSLQQVYSDVNTLHSAVKNRDLMLVLKSPVILADKKNAIFRALFGTSMDKLTLSYLDLLTKKGREAYLPEIASEFISQYKAMSKISTVKVTTAAPMDDAILVDIRKKLSEQGVVYDNVDIQASVNPELIGGFVLEFDNKRYDASVASKLEDLRGEFTKNLYIKEF
jgi:F-type H+-transporting ATPase subunit delta